MEILTYILAVSAHAVALILGLTVLHKYRSEFTAPYHAKKKGFDDVEMAYLTIVLSTILSPLSIYHLLNSLVNLSDFADINVWRAAYWLALGLLLSLFHVLTKHFMGE